MNPDRGMLLMVCFVCSLIGCHRFAGGQQPQWTEVDTPRSVEELEQLQQRVMLVAEKTRPAVVSIFNEQVSPSPDRRKETAFGEGGASGFIISPAGLVLSNAHVSHLPSEFDETTGLKEIKKPGDIVSVILHDGRRLKAKLLGADFAWDVSMLQILDADEGPFEHLLLSGTGVELGDWMLKHGHPGGYHAERGAVTRLGRTLIVGQSTFATDCRIKGGDSGGPYLTLEGRVAGISQPHFRLPEAFLAEFSKRQQANQIPSPTLPSSVLQELIAAMANNEVRRKKDFEVDFRVRREYRDVRRYVSLDSATQGEKIRNAWSEVAMQTRGCVVTVLRDDLPAAFGTVVRVDGRIVTKASEIDDSPACVLPNGKVLPARVISIDVAHDLAVLQVDAQGLKPVSWRTSPLGVGNFLMTADHQGGVLAWGIVSVPAAKRSASPIDQLQRAPARTSNDRPPAVTRSSFRHDGFPVAFEHDTPLLQDQCGGPLFDLSGKAVGITVARVGPYGCAAIPSETIKQILSELAETEP
ncbi:MAG: trypsin-like peptidase domain-containing protein [Pirellulales bacterium]|nr:trypsin-like peptidase domain-containing protein [Pirellulales bacterium]